MASSQVQGDFKSVTEQSGIQAGDGGFQIQVNGNTDLKGGVIASSQAAIDQGKNSLTTTTLTASDLQNKDTDNASGFSVGLTASADPHDKAGNAVRDTNGGDLKGSLGSTAGIGQTSAGQDSTTKSGISAGMLTVTNPDAGSTVASVDRTVITGQDSGALQKNWDGQQLMGQVQAQVDVTSRALPVVTQAFATYADTKAKDLRNQGNEAEAEKWDEGGTYRVAGHVALGALGGGAAGAVSAGAAAAAAPVLNQMQDALQGQLGSAGLGDTAAKEVAQLVTGSAAAGMGAATGAQAGALTALNEDANNRQLHPDEQRWITSNAQAFADKEGISKDEALQRLTQQAAKQTDALWNLTLSDATDAEAKDFLATSGATFKNDQGQQQQLFTATVDQYTRPELYAPEAQQAFVDKNLKTGVVRTPLTGLTDKAGEVVQAAAADPSAVGGKIVDATVNTAAALLNSAAGCIAHPLDCAVSVKDSMVTTGTALGEGLAVATDSTAKNQLNAIYGQDVSGAQQTLTAYAVRSWLVGRLGPDGLWTGRSKRGPRSRPWLSTKLPRMRW